VATTPADLRRRLAEALPLYMMPAHWLHFDSLPLNANGKVDRPLLRRRFLAEAAVS
jgi:acyl-CoA synthetase (AMP-forming)/AMP-acid ligase II